jgi:hypothetical protein
VGALADTFVKIVHEPPSLGGGPRNFVINGVTYLTDQRMILSQVPAQGGMVRSAHQFRPEFAANWAGTIGL